MSLQIAKCTDMSVARTISIIYLLNVLKYRFKETAAGPELQLGNLAHQQGFRLTAANISKYYHTSSIITNYGFLQLLTLPMLILKVQKKLSTKLISAKSSPPPPPPPKKKNNNKNNNILSEFKNMKTKDIQRVDSDEVAQPEPSHLDLHCLLIQLFSFLALYNWC